MREILFRGKRTGDEKWICGHLLEQNIPDCHSYIVMSIIAELDNRHIEIMDFDINEVIPETVGQFTGLTDKNGVKIFEGDIIQSLESSVTGLVQWFPEHSAFMVWCKSANEVGFLYECAYIIKVIGNIHDNPKLLKVGDNNE